jgi:predicted nucleotide-binding protein (sugar kinase/HSP70/actin superfamily)
MWRTLCGRKPSATSAPSRDRRAIRVGIPRVLNIWSTHQFWLGFLTAIGIPIENIVFSSDTSEEQGRDFGKGRGSVDCCYPVKCMSGHYGELLFGQKKKLDVLLSPMIYTLPSFLGKNVLAGYACTRVMTGAENIKAGFLKERDVFAENGIRYAAPVVSLGEPELVTKQLDDQLREVFDLRPGEAERAVAAGWRALRAFDAKMRRASRAILETCAKADKPCVLVLARPYHMDPGVGHEIEAGIQACGFPVLWMQYFPIDDDLLQWMFAEDLRSGRITHPFDIRDVWPSSYSANTNEMLWAAKAATRCPWITCVVRLSSYECGMDQPTFTPVQKIIEATGTLFFKFGDLDSTKPAGSVKIRIETIVHYVRKHSAEILRRKLEMLGTPGPLSHGSARPMAAPPSPARD